MLGRTIFIIDGTHNAYGERVKATYGQQTNYYLYDNQKRVAELDASGKIRQQYFYLPVFGL